MRRGSGYLLAFLAVLGWTAVAPNASAYVVGSCSSATAAPSATAGGQPIIFTAVFKQPDCTPFPGGIPVTFSQASGPALCQVTFNPVMTTTDAHGVASTTVILPPECPGQFVLVATAAGGGSVSVTVIETGGGFPNTTADNAGQPGMQWWVVTTAGVTLLLVVALWATAVLLRRRRSAH